MSSQNTNKLAVYIDGFNLYHAIDDLNKPRLKWLNLHALGKSLLRAGEELAKVQFFTTIVDWNIHKKMHHTAYVNALEAKGVVVTPGNFKQISKHCSKNNWMCPFREEKQTDVAIAVNLIGDAYTGVFTRAVLLTADTDQIPTLKWVLAHLPHISLTWLAPPGRMQQAREIGNLITDRSELTEGTLGTCRLPLTVTDKSGKYVCDCPQAYR